MSNTKDIDEAIRIHISYTDSDSDSGKSEFDEDYYRYKPPSQWINPAKTVVVKPVNNQNGHRSQQLPIGHVNNDFNPYYNNTQQNFIHNPCSTQNVNTQSHFVRNCPTPPYNMQPSKIENYPALPSINIELMSYPTASQTQLVRYPPAPHINTEPANYHVTRYSNTQLVNYPVNPHISTQLVAPHNTQMPSCHGLPQINTQPVKIENHPVKNNRNKLPPRFRKQLEEKKAAENKDVEELAENIVTCNSYKTSQPASIVDITTISEEKGQTGKENKNDRIRHVAPDDESSNLINVAQSKPNSTADNTPSDKSFCDCLINCLCSCFY